MIKGKYTSENQLSIYICMPKALNWEITPPPPQKKNKTKQNKTKQSKTL